MICSKYMLFSECLSANNWARCSYKGLVISTQHWIIFSGAPLGLMETLLNQLHKDGADFLYISVSASLNTQTCHTCIGKEGFYSCSLDIIFLCAWGCYWCYFMIHLVCSWFLGLFFNFILAEDALILLFWGHNLQRGVDPTSWSDLEASPSPQANYFFLLILGSMGDCTWKIQGKDDLITLSKYELHNDFSLNHCYSLLLILLIMNSLSLKKFISYVFWPNKKKQRFFQTWVTLPGVSIY